ncbi:cysteine proteinase [Thozetella sp. PMI_491]|nr:cysteine proteinase [Thozetella sp. PMI_491]
MDETLEHLQARHRKEKKELQGRITNKKKNATKKNRKAVNDECAELESQQEEAHRSELAELNGETLSPDEELEEETEAPGLPQETETDILAAKIDATHLSGPAPVEEAAEGGGGGPGKKRNRQKERLARRAAEQEAAAVAAEAEAANMVDHRGIEKTYMLKEFAAHGLTEREIAPDGHCLFAAVADQLAAHTIPLDRTPGDAPKVLPYKVVRRTAAAYMEAHPDDYAAFLEEPLAGYVAKIRDTAEWGGQLELSALANAYRVGIKVVQDGRTEVIRPNQADEDKTLPTIWLAYYRHGYGLGEHYNSLRKAP